MKSKVISQRSYFSDGAEDFERDVNKALGDLENNNCMIHSFQYSTHAYGKDLSYTIHSVLIFYDEVPTRTVIIEKTEK
jgi:hypothetical protein